jgi:hypothetical protein
VVFIAILGWSKESEEEGEEPSVRPERERLDSRRRRE